MTPKFDPMNHMIDITGPTIVQVEVSPEGTLWVNVDGICRLRVCHCPNVLVTDNRPPHLQTTPETLTE